jgi:hypothetical protein
MRYDLVPGTVFPDYQLPDHTGTPLFLRQYLFNGRVLSLAERKGQNVSA